MPNFTSPLRYSVLHGELKMAVENWRTGRGGRHERTALATLCILQVAGSCMQVMFPFYLLCFGTILRWKVALKLELLQNMHVLRILQLRERSHARSRNVYSFQIGSFFFFFFFFFFAVLHYFKLILVANISRNKLLVCMILDLPINRICIL